MKPANRKYGLDNRNRKVSYHSKGLSYLLYDIEEERKDFLYFREWDRKMERLIISNIVKEAI